MFDNMALGKILSSEKENTSGSCPMPEGKFPVETPAAMAYVPFQQWGKTVRTRCCASEGNDISIPR